MSDGKPLPIEFTTEYSRYALTTVVSILDERLVLPFLEEIEATVDPDSDFAVRLSRYLEIAQRIEAGYPEPENVVVN